MLSDRLLDDRFLNVGLDGDRFPGEGRPGDGPLAGFGAWLAGRLVPLAQRRCVHDEVERFLIWQRAALPDGTVGSDPAMQRPAVWCYLLKRQREDCDDAEALRLWGALELFLSYVDAQRAEHLS